MPHILSWLQKSPPSRCPRSRGGSLPFLNTPEAHDGAGVGDLDQGRDVGDEGGLLSYKVRSADAQLESEWK